MWSECCNVGGRELGEWREGILASSLLSLGWGGAKLLASLEPQVPWPSPPRYPLAAWSLRSGWGLQLSRAAAVAFEVNTEKQQMLCWEGWVFIAGRPGTQSPDPGPGEIQCLLISHGPAGDRWSVGFLRSSTRPGHFGSAWVGA